LVRIYFTEEPESLADYEKLITRVMKDKEFMKMYQEFVPLIDSATYLENVWNAVT